MRYLTLPALALVLPLFLATNLMAQQGGAIPGQPETWLIVTAKIKKVDDQGAVTMESARDASFFARRSVMTLDGSSSIRIDGLKPGKLAFGAEKIETIKPLLRKKQEFRYVGADMADLKPGENRKELILERINVLDDYCLRCHPSTRKEFWQVARDRHPSGVPLPAVYKPRFDLSGLKLNSAGQVGCETCHTIHLDKGSQFNLLHPLEGSVLCLKCH